MPEGSTLPPVARKPSNRAARHTCRALAVACQSSQRTSRTDRRGRRWSGRARAHRARSARQGLQRGAKASAACPSFGARLGSGAQGPPVFASASGSAVVASRVRRCSYPGASKSPGGQVGHVWRARDDSASKALSEPWFCLRSNSVFAERWLNCAASVKGCQAFNICPDAVECWISGRCTWESGFQESASVWRACSC